ncbi:MAG: hypothetical protein Q4G49_01920 [Paracoccus sp. (in: a-proteobacteria)]|nr:hypothetical protein [Paracoccus sp. (in: a-proteobacteria)]
MVISCNCLPGGASLHELVRRECIERIDIRFCRNDAAEGADETCIITCVPAEAEFATSYGITDIGEAIAIHDVDLNASGADELATACRALFVTILDARRDPPDAAQRHQAEQDALSALHRSVE